MNTKTRKYENIGVTPNDWRGRWAKDVVSGFEGAVIARYDYINGCVRLEVAGTDKDGKPEAFIFDEQQLQWAESWIEGYEPKAALSPLRRTGGPRDSRPVPR